ncbi:MAG: hypothetical protein M1820_001079 [Bogoriella megaspora]|nr:MAG: hypothetical protein M1820_001079 [Bogoriella megaspora]
MTSIFEQKQEIISTTSTSQVLSSRPDLASHLSISQLQYEPVMQKLWSRTFQTSPGRCPRCRPSSPGIARKSATFASARTLVRPFASSTILYTTVFAVATVYDGKRKRERREQWDAAIAKARYSVAALQEQTEEIIEEEEYIPIVESLEEIPEDQMEEDSYRAGVKQDAKPDSEWVLYDSAKEGYMVMEEPSPSDMSLLDEVQPNERQAPVNMGISATSKHHTDPQSIYASRFTRHKAGTKLHTPKKMRTIDLSIEKLVIRALLHAKLHDLDTIRLGHDSMPDAIHGLVSSSRKDLEELLATTQSKLDAAKNLDPHTPREPIPPPSTNYYPPTFHQDQLCPTNTAAFNLNSSLSSLFRLALEGTLPSHLLIAKITHNLLISSYPPDITTYNTLLRGFARLHNHGAYVLMAIDSLHETHIRHNELTYIEILRYYIRANNAKDFSLFVGRMRGKGNGIMLAKDGIRVTHASAGRLVPNAKFPHKIIQKPSPDPRVLSTLLVGYLKFYGFERALGFYRMMRKEGWGLDILGLTVFLKHCTLRRDWNGGKVVWERILELREGERARMKREIERGWRTGGMRPLSPYAYHWMLSLCDVCDKKDEFEEIRSLASGEGFSVKELCDISKKSEKENWAPG